MRARHQISEAFALQLSHERAADEAAMAGYEDFFGFFHLGSDTCGLAFSFLRRCAILSSWEKPERVWESRKLTSCLSAENLSAEKVAASCRRMESTARCSQITVAPRGRIFGTRSWRRGTRLPAGRNKARICAGKFYIARRRCSRCERRSCAMNSPAAQAAAQRKPGAEWRKRSIVSCIMPAGPTSSDKFSAR